MQMSSTCFSCVGCSRLKTRNFLQDHLRVCEFATAPCPNFDLGCLAKVTKGDQEKHLDEECQCVLSKCLQCQQQVLRREEEVRCLSWKLLPHWPVSRGGLLVNEGGSGLMFNDLFA